MTQTVIATFANGETARRAAVAIGRTELAAGPTRVQVATPGTGSAARLELRVEEPDAARAIALLRDHGADVAARDEIGPDLRSRGVTGALAAWGMVVADVLTAAMSGAVASDAQVPADPRGRGKHDGAARAATSGVRRDADDGPASEPQAPGSQPPPGA